MLERFGERGRNRTYNLLIKSQLLCQLSYAPFWGMAIGFEYFGGGKPTAELLYLVSNQHRRDVHRRAMPLHHHDPAFRHVVQQTVLRRVETN